MKFNKKERSLRLVQDKQKTTKERGNGSVESRDKMITVLFGEESRVVQPGEGYRTTLVNLARRVHGKKTGSKAGDKKSQGILQTRRTTGKERNNIGSMMVKSRKERQDRKETETETDEGDVVTCS